MYFLLSLYCCAYINMIIYKTKDRASYIITYSSLVTGILNIYHFIFLDELTDITLVIYIFNTVLSGLFVYMVRNYKVNFINPNMLLFDLSVHITAILTFLFSIINILEFYEFI